MHRGVGVRGRDQGTEGTRECGTGVSGERCGLAGDGEAARGALDIGKGFKEIGDDLGDGGFALGCPNAGAAIGLVGYADGDIFHDF